MFSFTESVLSWPLPCAAEIAQKKANAAVKNTVTIPLFFRFHQAAQTLLVCVP
jgi:hypothetical protein